MAYPALKSLIATFAGATILGIIVESTPAKAAVLTYDFTVDIQSGQYVGKYSGTYSFDTSKDLLPCPPISGGPSNFLCATVAQNDLSINFNFLGNTFLTNNDRDFASGFPALYFSQDRRLVGVSYLVANTPSVPNFSVLGREFYLGFSDNPDPVTKANRVGSVNYLIEPFFPPPNPSPGTLPPGNDDSSAAVPEPSEIAGSAVAVGLLGLVWRFRRRRGDLKDPSV